MGRAGHVRGVQVSGMNIAYNEDCLAAMRKMPDKAFDLAVVDPPYGGGATHTHTHTPRSSEELQTMSITKPHASGKGLNATLTVSRTGGTWATKYQRERRKRTMCVIGTLHRQQNTLTNSPAFPKTKSSLGLTTLACRRQGASWCGAKPIYRLKGLRCRPLSMRGRASTVTP